MVVVAVGSEHSYSVTSGKLAIIITKGNLKKCTIDIDIDIDKKKRSDF